MRKVLSLSLVMLALMITAPASHQTPKSQPTKPALNDSPAPDPICPPDICFVSQ